MTGVIGKRDVHRSSYGDFNFVSDNVVVLLATVSRVHCVAVSRHDLCVRVQVNQVDDHLLTCLSLFVCTRTLSLKQRQFTTVWARKEDFIHIT